MGEGWAGESRAGGRRRQPEGVLREAEGGEGGRAGALHKCQLGWHWDNTIKSVGSLYFSVTVPKQLILKCSIPVLLRMLNSALPWTCSLLPLC